jgi:hypothetical protein
MPRLLAYRIVTDLGAAPHILNGYLTLTICKPMIRKGAKIGDYVLALVAQSNPNIPKVEDKYFLVAYLFKITDIVRMEDYEEWCKTHSPGKICTDEMLEGDCQYGPNLKWRPGPHYSTDPAERDELIRVNLSGVNSIISNYYAAWQSREPHVLTDEEIAGLGLTREELKGVKRGHRCFDLPDTTMADKLIDGWVRKESRGNGKSKRACRTRKKSKN